MDENMLRMQQEAAERVRKMQERARKFVEDEPVDTPAKPIRSDHTEQPSLLTMHRPDQAPRPEHGSKPEQAPLVPKSEPVSAELVHKEKYTSFLSNFGKDREQLLLLMLAVLLVKNNAPIELILALLYLAM